MPVIEVRNVRAFYSWNVNVLARNALQALQARNPSVDAEAVGLLLRSFLDRVYFDLRNLVFASPDRALNYAATNAFQAADVCTDAVAAVSSWTTSRSRRAPSAACTATAGTCGSSSSTPRTPSARVGSIGTPSTSAT